MANLAPRPPSEDYVGRTARLERLRKLSRLLDEAIAIPGTDYRVGLDPLIGLVPGGGDTIGLILSSIIVIESARLGASKSALTVMVFNIVLETVVGTLPVVGDVFDVAWKSNVRNMRLLEKHVQTPQVSQRQNLWFVIGLLVALVVVFVGSMAIAFWLVSWIVASLAG
ncbi:MAG TPA: DUF4112 domain-containing protein [Chroococcidiopsis sp.]